MGKDFLPILNPSVTLRYHMMYRHLFPLPRSVWPNIYQESLFADATASFKTRDNCKDNSMPQTTQRRMLRGGVSALQH